MGLIKTTINNILMRFNCQLLEVNNSLKHTSKARKQNRVLLNIGSGNWSHDGWTNLDHLSDWYNKDQRSHHIIPYNIREDSIPYEDNTVDAIYCSHVIEHIENIHIEKLFRECFRVLKKGGIIRITCPDSEFLYNVSKTSNDYWVWRDSWFKSEQYYDQKYKPRTIDYLVREVATPMLLHYKNSINTKDYTEAYEELSMTDFFEYLTKELVFREDYVGDHINYWNFEKTNKYLTKAGFPSVFESKYGASVFLEMQYITKFDTTHPNMSLYVEAIK